MYNDHAVCYTYTSMSDLEATPFRKLDEIDSLLSSVIGDSLLRNESMSRHTTLKVGGPAQWFWSAQDVNQLSNILSICTNRSIPYLFVGHGSNLLMSDAGYAGLIIKNRCKNTTIGRVTAAESGVSFGSLYLQTARAGYSGLEWAIGIPGTVGGALVSNAGAYRGNIGPLVRSLRVFTEGSDLTVGPEWMEFSYRDSRLRRYGVGRDVILSCELNLNPADPLAIQATANVYKAERRVKQPVFPSAGSFFKNVNNREFAESLSGLPPRLREAGVVPAGFLIEICGLKGFRVGGAGVSIEHANFLINAVNASASDIRDLASIVKARVFDKFGVEIEEEVLYVGDWSSYRTESRGNDPK